MEDKNHVGADAIPGLHVSHVNILGRHAALALARRLSEQFPHLGAAALAAVFEAASEELAAQGSLLRSRGIR